MEEIAAGVHGEGMNAEDGNTKGMRRSIYGKMMVNLHKEYGDGMFSFSGSDSRVTQ